MKKINNKIKIGTKVMIAGINDNNWVTVKSFHDTRKWLKVDGWQGDFQAGHIEKFTNK